MFLGYHPRLIGFLQMCHLAQFHLASKVWFCQVVALVDIESRPAGPGRWWTFLPLIMYVSGPS